MNKSEVRCHKGPWVRALSLVALVGAAGLASAAGVLMPVSSADQPPQILDHHVNVVINNGFAMTEVTQVFLNPNAKAIEAIYSFPVPKSASVSELIIHSGETVLQGEVVKKEKAREVYETEKQAGNQAGLAEKNSFLDFRFHVANVQPQVETRVRFLYYQPLDLDTNIGRYLYPLEDGGTDEVTPSFWTRKASVDRSFSIAVELKSAYPVEEVRVPGMEAAAVIDKIGEGHYKVDVQLNGATLERDFVFYYRLVDGLPGRIELLPYRADAGSTGTFMLVITPGVDLAPLQGGVDHVFVLDTSGSMAAKIATLASGVKQAIGALPDTDRMRIYTFSDSAREMTSGWTPLAGENVQRVLGELESIVADGSTNLYDGMEKGLQGLDADRATNFIIVTDGVTNTGIVEPAAFDKLMRTVDVRVFGFLLGNGGNWPLMETINRASGGFYDQISNADDIYGKILLAKSKITHECLHDVSVKIRGVKTFDLTREAIGKVYRGQQMVIFGHYEGGGTATVEVVARKTGEDQSYTATFEFPEIDDTNPEVERLWALAQIEELEHRMSLGKLQSAELSSAVADLGVAYQLVTDETSMVALDDARFAAHGIARDNQVRVAREEQARALRAAAPARDLRVDAAAPAFSAPSATLGGGGGGGGGGAFDPLTGTLTLAAVVLALAARRRRGA